MIDAKEMEITPDGYYRKKGVVCYQYNFSNGTTEFIAYNIISDNEWLYCDHPKYHGYPVCAWKIKNLNQ
jgi:hypothetical protein